MSKRFVDQKQTNVVDVAVSRQTDLPSLPDTRIAPRQQTFYVSVLSFLLLLLEYMASIVLVEFLSSLKLQNSYVY